MMAIGTGYATIECAIAAAGTWLTDAYKTGIPFRPRNAETTIEIDSDNGMSVPVDPAAARKQGRTHSTGCGFCGTDNEPDDDEPAGTDATDYPTIADIEPDGFGSFRFRDDRNPTIADIEWLTGFRNGYRARGSRPGFRRRPGR